MIRPQLRPVSLHHDRSKLLGVAVSSLRQFSAAQPRAEGGSRPSDRPRPSGPPRKPPGQPRPSNNSSPRPRPQRGGVDARSFGAPKSGDQPANLVRRGPNFRKPFIRGPNPARPTARTTPKGRKEPRRKTGMKRVEEEEGDDERLDEVNEVYRQIAEGSKPVAIRHEPQSFDYSSLRETWPSFPTDTTACAAGVSEKLAGLSERYPNGYEPPFELGKRLFDGKPVLFASEEERTEAVAEAKKLAQKQSEKLTQEKGDLVEPEEVNFEPINEANRKSLLKTLVGGDYSEPNPQLAAGKAPVFGEIMANLGKNATYRTAGKSSQFVGKVEALLSSNRPAAKRG